MDYTDDACRLPEIGDEVYAHGEPDLEFLADRELGQPDMAARGRRPS